MSEEEVAVENEKSGGSVIKLALVGVLGLMIGYGAGAFTGQPLVAALGLDQADADSAPDVVDLAGAEVRTWRMPVAGESYDGIWAKRYWTEDAKIKQAAPDVIDHSI